MATHFYERSAYKLSEEPVPNCFVQLDATFHQRLPGGVGEPPHIDVVLAESICSRMADVEMYAFLIEDARKRKRLDPANLDRESDLKAAVLNRAFTIGYLGACRALLDSGAATLVALHELPIGGAECTFGSGNFWHQLVVKEPNVHRRYQPLRLFFNEVLHWCNETAARVPPLVVLQAHYGEFSRREQLIQVVDSADVTLPRLAADTYGVAWIDPLDLHRRWKTRLLTLCEKLCEDIATQS